MAAERHHPVRTIRSYLEAGNPGALQVTGSPPVTVDIDPAAGSIGFRTPAGSTDADLSAYRWISFEPVLIANASFDTVRVTVPAGALDETYTWMCTVIDHIQLDAMSPGDAVATSLAALDSMLAQELGMSIEQQIGLFGELVFVDTLCRARSPHIAVSSWFGADSEEHDFRLGDIDVEVKTTTGERRRHWISSRSQLEPQQGRELLVLSVQLTPAPPKVGLSLPELVDRVDTGLGGGPLHTDFRDKLDAVGYVEESAALARRRWSLRRTPCFFTVDDSFPTIRPDDLTSSVADPARIVEFRYLVDLEGLATRDLGIDFEPIEKP